MLESFAATFLNRFLGSYVENFDANQLEVGIWNGDVKLKNCKIKNDCLDALDLPISIKQGVLGNLTMQVPWSRLKSSPVKIEINDIYLLVEPKSWENYDPKETLEREFKKKMAKLAQLELLSNTSTSSSLTDDSATSNESFTTSLINKVVDNVQVSIENIHIRYEDYECLFSREECAMGICFQQLSAKTCNDDWEESFVEVVKEISKKIVTLDNLGVYIRTGNNVGESFLDEDIDVFISRFKESVVEPNVLEQLIHPISGTCKLSINKKGSTAENPRFNASLDFDSIGFEIFDSQYQTVLDIMANAKRFEKSWIFKEIRPLTTVMQSPDEWLKYVLQCVLTEIHEKNKQYTWENMKRVCNLRREYTSCWKQKLLTRRDGTLLDKDLSEKLLDLHKELPLDEIMLFRSIAKKVLLKERKEETLKEQKDIENNKLLVSSSSNNSSSSNEPELDSTTDEAVNNNQKGWFSSWWGGGEEASKSSAASLEFTEEQKKEFYDAIEYDEHDHDSTGSCLPKDRITLNVVNKLKTGFFKLKNRNSGLTIAELLFSDATTRMFQRPDSFGFQFELNTFSIEDKNQNSTYRNIVKVNTILNDPESNAEDFFKVYFEKKPVGNDNADSLLNIKLNTMSIYYNPQFITSITNFFKTSDELHDTLAAVIASAGTTVEGWTQQTRIGLESIIEEHKNIDLNLDLKAPLIILPIYANRWDSACVLIDAGNIKVTSDLIQKSNIEKIKQMSLKEYQNLELNDSEKIERFMYDRFNMELNNLQLLVGPDIKTTVDSLRQSNNGVENSWSVIGRSSLSILFDVSIFQKALNYPKFKMNLVLPLLKLNLSDYQYRILIQVAAIFGFQPVQDDDVNNDVIDLTTNKSLQQFLENTKDFYSKLTENQLKQKLFEMNVRVDQISLNLKKKLDEKLDNFISICSFTGSQMKLSLSKFYEHMDVDFLLNKILLTENTTGESKILISCTENADESTDLFKLGYMREQRIVHYDGFLIDVYDQTANLDMSSLLITLNSKSILTIMTYLRNTFTDVSNAPLPTDMLKHNDDKNIEESPQKMKVNLNLEKVSLIFEEMQNEKLASLSFSDSSLSIYLLPEKLKIHGKLKHLELFDLIYENYNSEIRQLIYMDDENEFSEFKYETFDCEKSDKDVTSNLEFKASSLKIKFMEQTFGRLFEYFNNLQEMKSIFDKTRSITFDNSPDLDTIKKIKLDILVKTPIIEFPSILNPVDNICDNMIFYLGEFNLVNEFNSLNMTSYKSSLTNMKVTSLLNFLDKKQFLHMIENLDISLNMDVQNGVENKAKSIDIFGQLSNSELNLTNLQIDYLRNIMNTVVSTFNPPASSITEKSGSENDLDSIWNVAMKANAVITPNAVYKAEADELDKTPPVAIEKSTSISTAPSLNLKFSIPIMSLTLYDNTDNKEFVDECSLTKVSLNGSKLELSKDDTNLEKMKLNYTLGSFSVKDLRNYKENVHSDLIPFCSKSENQLTVNYSETMIDGNEIIKKSHIILDNLRVILAVDYLIAMKVFWNKIVLSPVGNSHSALLNKSLVSQPSLKTSKNKEAPKDSTIKSKSQITFEALNPNIVLLANLELEDSEAFVFKVEHLLFDNLVQEQNEVISLNMLNIGMFMCNMNTFEKSHIRLVDDFSTSFYQNKTGQVSNLKLDIEDMIIRVALRDIRLGNKIFKKSLHLATTNGLFGDSLAMRMNANGQKGIKFSREFKLALAKYAPSVLSSFTFMEKDEENISTLSSNIQPSVIVTDENFNVNFGGARLVIIGDVSELPMIDFHTEKLQIGIKDWSTDLNFITNLTLYTNVFNYSKSDWEPLIEPFTFTIEGFRGRKAGVENSSDAAMNINISSNDSSDITISSQSLKLLSKIPQSLSVDSVEELVKLSRDETKPFKIKNDTGISIQVWVYNYHDKNQRTNLTTIADGESIPWEFEDWIKLRENLDTDNTNSTIVFKPIGDEYASTFKINTKTETETLFRLEPPINNVHSRIECKIKLGDDGIKLIHFASPLKFTNYTSADLELFYNEYDSIVIEKKTTKSIPIDKVYYSEYEIKPITTNDDYIKSVQKIKWKDILNSSIMKSKCLNSKTGEYFYFDVTCQYNSKEKLTAVFPHMEIIVSAPFMIENALPMEAHFNIVSKETGENINFNLKSGSVLPIHNINFSDDLVFLKTFPFDSGYTPKDYTLIAAPKKLNLPVEDSTVLTRRENKVVNTLKLSISYNSDPITNCHIVKVFVPFIILNKTSRCIYINEKKKNNIFACPVNTNEQDETYSGIQMISFENTVKTNEKDTNKNALAQIKMFDTDWSLPISLDAIGKDLDLILPIPNKTNGNEIGVNIKEGFGIFADTKIITITPRFIITNYTNQNLVFNETMSLAEFLLENKQPIPIYKMSMNADKYCRLKVYSEGEQAEYCEPFELNIKSDLDYVKLRDPKTGKHILIKIEKLMDKSTLFINLKNSQDSWPFSIRNFTETTFTIYQRDPRVKNSFIKKKQGENEVVEYDQTLAKMSSDIGYYKTMKIFDSKRYNLSEYSIMPFSWDFPSAKDKKLMIQCGNVVRTIDLQMIGSLRPLVISSMVNGAEERTFIELNILADGPTLALVLTKYNPDVSIYKINTYEKKPTHSIYNDSNDVDSFNTSSNELSSTNSQSLFKVPDSQKIDVATLRVLFNVSGVGISIVNKRLKEISYSKIKGIEVRYNNSKIYNSVSWKIKWLQIDNQLFEDNYKNVLYPTIVTDRRDDMEQHPVFSGSVTKVNDETTGMTYIKHATLLLQEMSLNLDEEFVIEVMDFLNLITIPNTFNKNNSANKFSGSHNDNIMTPYLEIVKENAESNEEADGIALGETDYYHLTLPLCSKKLERKNLHFENLHIQPTVMHFSFMRSESIQLQDNCMDLITLTQRKKASSFLNAIYMTLGNISDAPVKLNSLIMENYKTSANTLKEDVISHYNTEIYNQLLKLVGYADVLGNPIGLLNNLSNGVADIFYNPYQDGYYMNDRPEELGISFSKGGMSFLKKSVFGFSDSFAKFTGSVAKGLTAATNDKNFQRERYLQQRKNKFSNDANSFSSGFNSLVQGVSSGFKGIATNPLEGAKKDGTAGFFRGLGKGLVGMPTKTMIGFLDMANNVSDGIKTSTGAYDPNDPYNSKNGHYETIVRSLRYPRYISNGLCFSLDPMDGLIKPYDKRQAYGQYLLKTCNSGEFLYDNYVDHEYLPGNQRVVIVSEENLLEVNIENMKVTFRLKIEEICKMGAPVDDGRQIIVRGRDPNTNMICQGRFPIIDLKAKQRILTKILLAQSKVIKYMDTEL